MEPLNHLTFATSTPVQRLEATNVETMHSSKSAIARAKIYLPLGWFDDALRLAPYREGLRVGVVMPARA
jgi:hypothetical protein